MINSLTITNDLGDSLDIELRYPEKSGIAVQKIDGLGPSDADLNLMELASNDGSIFTSSRINSRNIVLKLKFIDGLETIEEIRLKTYRYFPVKKLVKLAIFADDRQCYIYGYVEKNTPDIFTKEAGCQISIMCPDPYFYSYDLQTTVFSGIEPAFEFPFGNDSLSLDLLEIGRVIIRTEQTVYYLGDADIGVVIRIGVLGTATGVKIYNNNTRQQMFIDDAKLLALTGSGLKASDEIIISTTKKNKGVILVRNGVSTNILNCINRDADWFTISKGDNLFMYTAVTGFSNLQFKIENQTAYEGV